ncbi:TVP38/TMEM64 family protein [Collimonas sp. NPDC087041]|uniref:TVP38/TMEM64 family protein n=1 Tax=Collimonas sp. NPDC087041 TaxID=3363960 RepID=UPI0037F281EB
MSTSSNWRPLPHPAKFAIPVYIVVLKSRLKHTPKQIACGPFTTHYPIIPAEYRWRPAPKMEAANHHHLRDPAMRPYKRLLIVVLFLAALLALFQFSGLRQHFNLAFLHQQIVDNKFSGLLIFVLLFCLGNMIQIPGWIFLAAAVLALGKVWGGLATYVAAVISCGFTFLTIRLIGGDAMRAVKNRYALKILNGLDAHPIKSIALLRVLFQTVPALNYALALSGVKFHKYLIGTMIGLPLPIMLYCVFFEYIGKVLHLH